MPVSLHTHSWYSLLEGASSVEALLERAQFCAYTSLALTDSNNLYGAVRFCDEAQWRGIRPIVGACLRQGRSRCVALVGDPAGYSNLCRIISRLQLAEPTATEPALPSLLRENAAGLHVLADDLDLAQQLREAFEKRLWLEVIRPRGPEARPGHPPGQEQELLEAGRRLGLELVASTAVHFATPEEYPVFRLLAAVRRGGLVDQLPRPLSIMPDHHLASRETWQRWFGDLPAAVRNTERLAEELQASVLPGKIVLPPARLPRALEAQSYLRLLCERGLGRRGLGNDGAAQERLRDELAVIAAEGLADYFLVVRDIARHARRQDYSMALRGSAGNSLVCYLLEITDVNPLRFDLPAERFLYPGRPDLPDIDLDFDWKVRDQVIAHVFRRYGAGHTAMISSHLFLQPRSAFREAARAHGLSNEQISRLLETAPAVPDTLGRPATAAFLRCPAGFPLEPQRWPRIVGDAQRLLGRPHHLSVHPGGIVITPRSIQEYVPVQRAAKGVVITQFEKDAVERIGLVKIDLLGNRALATVDEARARAGLGKCRPGKDDNDPATLQMLRRGDTLGVNQLESPAMRHLLVQLRPQGVADVILALALIRPGAAWGGVKERYLRRRHGLELFTIPPRLEALLRSTCGFMLYEDDAPRAVQALTGWTAAQAYRFHKRLRQQGKDLELRALAEEFVRACSRQGIAAAEALEQFRQLAKFQHYAFCKSHAVSYGLIAWKACCLKVQQPLAFWTAVLNNNQGMYPRRVYVEAIKRAGIELRLPCVNRSEGPFCIEEKSPPPPPSLLAPIPSPLPPPPSDGLIRVGLEAIGGLPEEFRERLLRERARHGPYETLADLCRRLAPGPETLALLIRCGALDGLGRSRPELFLEAELTAEEQKYDLEDRQRSFCLFPSSSWPTGPAWTPQDYPQQRRWRDEWGLLGFLLGPPLLSLFRSQLPAGLVYSGDLARYVGSPVRLAGIAAAYRNTQTAQGRDMQFLSLEDEEGLIEVTLFPGRCPPLPHLCLGPYLVHGVVEENLGVITVNAAQVRLLSSQSGWGAEAGLPGGPGPAQDR